MSSLRFDFAALGVVGYRGLVIADVPAVESDALLAGCWGSRHATAYTGAISLHREVLLKPCSSDRERESLKIITAYRLVMAGSNRAVCVLLVEDEWITLLAAETSLEEAGLNVLAAENGQQAIGYIARCPGYFSCLVTDFHMLDGVTGAHVIEHMRTAYPSIPMILTSALTHVVTGGWRLRFGVDLLPKPYDMTDLVVLVRRLTSRSRSSD